MQGSLEAKLRRSGKEKLTLIHWCFLKQQHVFPDNNVPRAETILLWIPVSDDNHDLNLLDGLHIKENPYRARGFVGEKKPVLKMRLLQSDVIYQLAPRNGIQVTKNM